MSKWSYPMFLFRDQSYCSGWEHQKVPDVPSLKHSEKNSVTKSKRCCSNGSQHGESNTSEEFDLFLPIWIRHRSDVCSRWKQNQFALRGERLTQAQLHGGKIQISLCHGLRRGALRRPPADLGRRPELKIPEAKKEDEGFYECHVTNGIGDQLRKSIRVEVQVPPKVAAGPSSMVVEKNKDSRKPKIQIQEFPTDKGVTSNLLLLHVDRGSSGLYVCKAKNSYGESYRIINVDVVEIPGQPKDLSVSQIWSRSLQLTWESPYHGNRPIISYTIHYWKTEGKSEPPPERPNVLRIASLQTVAVVPKLLPNSFYSLYVMAENEVGMGPPSETVTATTREEEPDWAPVDVTVLDKHATSAKLRWKCPQKNDWNAPLKGYYVGYKRMRIAKSFQLHDRGEGLQLRRDRAFFEQVVVHTADGGPPRTPHVKVIQTGGVTCNLKIWPRENSRSLPTAFVIHVREQNGDRHNIHVSVLPSLNYSIGGLSPATIKIITDQNDPSLLEPSAEPVYEKMYFVLPIVLSAVAILIMPIIACYCHNKLNPRPIATELIEDRDFLYAAATLHRLEATQKSLSSFSNSIQANSGENPSPALPTSYSTLQNYGTAIAENEPSTPPVSKATISVPDDGRYDSVVEEMRTFIKDKGSTKPKKVEAEVVEVSTFQSSVEDDSVCFLKRNNFTSLPFPYTDVTSDRNLHSSLDI
ncbi:titin [Caerostris extrusa]|uniref:Titin n=1 Tax=Caerostris extrusa TaxID=172846 RepID=A0AAV4RUY1_CAEEX|nr:titin [Caerostris extrusa]